MFPQQAGAAHGLRASGSLVSVGASRLNPSAARGDHQESLFNFGHSVVANTSLGLGPSASSKSLSNSKTKGVRKNNNLRTQTANNGRLPIGAQSHVYAQPRCIRSVVAPEVDLPQRLTMPVRINVPQRSVVATRDARIRSLFSSRAPSRQPCTETVQAPTADGGGNSVGGNSVHGMQRSKYDVNSYGNGNGNGGGANGNGGDKNGAASLRLSNNSKLKKSAGRQCVDCCILHACQLLSVFI
jgi:hypothetical protein